MLHHRYLIEFMNCIVVFNTFFLVKCSAFGSVPNEVASMGFLVSFLKRNWRLDWRCIIGKSFCRVSFSDKKDD